MTTYRCIVCGELTVGSPDEPSVFDIVDPSEAAPGDIGVSALLALRHITLCHPEDLVEKMAALGFAPLSVDDIEFELFSRGIDAQA